MGGGWEECEKDKEEDAVRGGSWHGVEEGGRTLEARRGKGPEAVGSFDVASK